MSIHDPRSLTSILPLAPLRRPQGTSAERLQPIRFVDAAEARRRVSDARSVWLRRIVRRLLSWIRREIEVERATRAMQRLDVRTLRDIGVEDRSQIPHLVRHGRML